MIFILSILSASTLSPHFLIWSLWLKIAISLIIFKSNIFIFLCHSPPLQTVVIYSLFNKGIYRKEVKQIVKQTVVREVIPTATYLFYLIPIRRIDQGQIFSIGTELRQVGVEPEHGQSYMYNRFRFYTYDRPMLHLLYVLVSGY